MKKHELFLVSFLGAVAFLVVVAPMLRRAGLTQNALSA